MRPRAECPCRGMQSEISGSPPLGKSTTATRGTTDEAGQVPVAGPFAEKLAPASPSGAAGAAHLAQPNGSGGVDGAAASST